MYIHFDGDMGFSSQITFEDKQDLKFEELYIIFFKNIWEDSYVVATLQQNNSKEILTNWLVLADSTVTNTLPAKEGAFACRKLLKERRSKIYFYNPFWAVIMK